MWPEPRPDLAGCGPRPPGFTGRPLQREDAKARAEQASDLPPVRGVRPAFSLCGFVEWVRDLIYVGAFFITQPFCCFPNLFFLCGVLICLHVVARMGHCLFRVFASSFLKKSLVSAPKSRARPPPVSTAGARCGIPFFPSWPWMMDGRPSSTGHLGYCFSPDLKRSGSPKARIVAPPIRALPNPPSMSIGVLHNWTWV